MKYIFSILLVLNFSYVRAAENVQPIKGACFLIKHAAPKSNLCIWADTSSAKAIRKKVCLKEYLAHQESDFHQIISFFAADKNFLKTIELASDDQTDPCDFLDKTAQLQSTVE